MKNILTTAGLAAVAVAGFQTKCAAQAVTVDDSKWWQVSASLRGFYDDNYTVAPKEVWLRVPDTSPGALPGATKLEKHDGALESFGFEIRPELQLANKGEQHTVKLTTVYSGRWFEDRTDEPWDHGVIADLAGEYRATENHIIRLNDNFAWTSEPTLLDAGVPVTTAAQDRTLRGEGTNIRNFGDLKYVGQFTPLFGLEVGYQNTFYDYEASGNGSYSALLDRMEHLIKGETRWTLSPTIAGVLGYWYEVVDFNSGLNLGPFPGSAPADVRNSTSHYIVAGGDYTVSPHCFISVRGGAQNITYDNLQDSPNDWNGFGDVSTTFEYAEGSYFRLGGKYGRTRTDAIGDYGALNPENLTLDEETGTVYGVVSHKVTESLTARVSGQAQYGRFNGGGYDNQEECLYLIGVTLVYDLTKNFAVEGGYNFDRVDSDDPNRSYSRNRVFLGVRGQF